MTLTPQQALRLRDAVDQIVLQPDAAPRWHVLAEAYATMPSADARAAITADVLARTPADGLAGFLRATLLAVFDPAYLAQAGALLAAIAPYDAARLMAYANYQWGSAIAGQAGHAAFQSLLQAARLPDLLQLAGRRLADDPAAAVRPAPRAVTALRKVALLAPFIGNANHPPTEMALQQATLLHALGVEVRLFSCQELLQPQTGQHLGNNGRALIAPPDPAALGARLPAGVNAWISDAQLSLTARWRQMLALLRDYDPDLVMFVGLYSPLLQPLYEARPVLALCVHAVAPMAPADVWLAADAQLAGRAGQAWGDALPPAWGHHHPFRVQLKPEPAPLARAELGLQDDSLVLVSVGARLATEIDGAWARRMLDVLERHPRAVWLLAGGAGAVPAALQAAAPGRIRTLAHRDDLRAVLRCCDIYVNPPRVGGGLSAAEAMAEGLPVLALAGADAGSKLGALAQPDDEAYFAALDALLADAALRHATGAALRRHFADTLDLAQSAPSLRAACELALERYQLRRQQGLQQDQG